MKLSHKFKFSPQDSTFVLLKWSPILNMEIDKGRLHLEENHKLVTEEVSWYLVQQYMVSPQGVYSKYSKFLLDIPLFKIMREVGSEQC